MDIRPYDSHRLNGTTLGHNLLSLKERYGKSALNAQFLAFLSSEAKSLGRERFFGSK